MRLMLLCAIATMLPIKIDSTAITMTISSQTGCRSPRPSTRMRNVSAKAATFGADAM